MTENIHTAMLQVMKQVTHVEKQTSRGVSYSFVTDAELVKALRQPMLDAGIYAHLTQIDQYDHEWTELGDKQVHSVMLRGAVRFTHAPSETSIDVHSVGEGLDYKGDKASNKAHTYLFKNAFLKAFTLEAVEQGQEPGNGNGHQPPRQRRQSKQQPTGRKKSWPVEDVERAETVWSDNGCIPPGSERFRVIGRLNLSNLEPGFSEQEALAWGKAYQGHRDSGLDPQAAAEKANQHVEPVPF